MALFIPDMAGHLFLVILLFVTFQHIEAQGHYPKPDITVISDGYFSVLCLIPGSVSPDSTCNLYVGEESQPSFTAKIKKRKATTAAGEQFCQFTPNHSDLISRLQSVRSKEVSCDYRVSSGPNSLSPRSDGYSFTDLVGVYISDPTTKPFPTEPLDFLWRHILTVFVLLATCGLIIHYVISHQCPKAVPKRSRRVDQSNEDFSLTVC
ncbi:uncharacterized protein isoform X2 [Salmo salar]|uniref:Uncharacterized protein isoform X2 n=1 Tax=Salmo salar TaxID=8030 RepID=A0ABM3EDJ6_SALSA|nr:uncharacterized protein LOC123723824 isoform X2 [Salmo salar]